MDSSSGAAGARHRSCSSRAASSVITRVVATVIHQVSAAVDAATWVRRSCWVPSAQTAAASSMPNAPHGRPAIVPSSCHSSSATPTAAAITPTSWRAASRSPNKARPHSAEKIGIV